MLRGAIISTGVAGSVRSGRLGAASTTGLTTPPTRPAGDEAGFAAAGGGGAGAEGDAIFEAGNALLENDGAASSRGGSGRSEARAGRSRAESSTPCARALEMLSVV